MATYKENDDFVPNPTDATGTVNTTRTGVPHNLDLAGSVFVQDRVETAQAIVDGEANFNHPEGANDVEGAENAAKDKAQGFLDKHGDFKPGDPTPAEKEAAEESEERPDATSQTEQPDVTDANKHNKSTKDLSSTKPGATTRKKADEKN